MIVYSIRDLEKLSGIKAHTIRIWEQRYKVLNPKRTESNIRYYVEDDLKLLLNVALLNRNGFKISKIARLSTLEINTKVLELAENTDKNLSQIESLTLAMIELDEYKFDRIISTNINQLGFEKTVLEIIYPFLDKLSVLWLTGSVNPSQENFITCLIRQKLIAAIDSLPVTLRDNNAKKFVLFLPETENQELSLLLIHYLVKSRKHRVIYLGNNILCDDVQDVADIVGPDYFFTIISEVQNDDQISKYLHELQLKSGSAEVLVTGIQTHQLELKGVKGIHPLKNLTDTIAFLDSI